MIDFKNSPIDKIVFEGRKLYIKRDDLLYSDFSGNKARKFHYFFKHPPTNIKKVVSYGSNQSNAMYSLSVLCKIKGWEFEYFVDHISDELLSLPTGNLKYALQNKMVLKLFKDCNYPQLKNKNYLSRTIIEDDILFIPEGGRCETSKYGINILAKEIIEFKKEKGFDTLSIFLPSGTGTTALFLQQSLVIQNDNSLVFTNSCVGDENYLKEQFFSLEKDEKKHPIILKTKKHRFGKLDCNIYKFWIKLQEKTGIEFDLLYDPLGFKAMMEEIKINEKHKNILYIHQGGIKGNESMLIRYKKRCLNKENR